MAGSVASAWPSARNACTGRHDGGGRGDGGHDVHAALAHRESAAGVANAVMAPANTVSPETAGPWRPK